MHKPFKYSVITGTAIALAEDQEHWCRKGTASTICPLKKSARLHMMRLSIKDS